MNCQVIVMLLARFVLFSYLSGINESPEVKIETKYEELKSEKISEKTPINIDSKDPKFEICHDKKEKKLISTTLIIVIVISAVLILYVLSIIIRMILKKPIIELTPCRKLNCSGLFKNQANTCDEPTENHYQKGN
ncbi:hypothetical protein RF11_14655 [Thelohanellus kitauei]|uniref:Uncharacterized protein n=1 Tax=Thelohanellus kitauei TaxID=669202 RepID=A0A0C2MI16_THEKT|nr:hypothetical protein RF11_14655 [Thelohanellus kitauei]